MKWVWNAYNVQDCIIMSASKKKKNTCPYKGRQHENDSKFGQDYVDYKYIK